jgi:hypothetical protein
MKVKVKLSLSTLTDGRERFAGKSGVVERAPLGRLVYLDPTNPEAGVEHVEAAYEVRFPDGDEAVFTADQLDGEGLIPHVDGAGRTPFGPLEVQAAVVVDSAKVKKVKA